MYQILVVEDDSRLNQAVCNFLNNSGYTTFGALNALEAYDAMYHTKFDLIISDIMMPEVDGFEFAETVRERDKVTPILLPEGCTTTTGRPAFAASRAAWVASAFVFA